MLASKLPKLPEHLWIRRKLAPDRAGASSKISGFETGSEVRACQLTATLLDIQAMAMFAGDWNSGYCSRSNVPQSTGNQNFFFGSISLSIYFCRPLTNRRRESNPGRLGGKRERFLCAMPSPPATNTLGLAVWSLKIRLWTSSGCIQQVWTFLAQGFTEALWAS